MSIEIKQMVIKSTLVSERSEHQYSESPAIDIESLKEQLMEECKALIEHSLKESQER